MKKLIIILITLGIGNAMPTYTIKPGDTLSKISRDTGYSVDELANYNRIDPNMIMVGQQLSIPYRYPGAEMSEAVPTSRAVPVQSIQEQIINELTAYGITDKDKQAAILGSIEAESNFTPQTEPLYKFTAKNLYDLYGPKQSKNKVRFKTLQDAQNVVDKGEQEVGEVIYGGRMGNKAAGEGYKYRGRGYIQLTGKNNYADMSKKLGIDLVNNPDLANDPTIAYKIAIEYIKDKKNINLDNVFGAATDPKERKKLINKWRKTL